MQVCPGNRPYCSFPQHDGYEMKNTLPVLLLSATLSALLSACGSDATGPTALDGNSQASDASSTQASSVDMTCDLAAYPSQVWTQCEQANFARTGDAIREQLASREFFQQYQTQSMNNLQSWFARLVADISWLSPLSGNTGSTPVCTTWSGPCTGNPFLYPEANGRDGKTFYSQVAEVTPVVFYDSQCARISGRVWLPKGSQPGAQLPNIVIQNGSVQAPETLYWWAAQLLVRNGYAVLTFDPRGQGRSDQQTPQGEQGSNANPTVFWTGLVDAIDFFRSTSSNPYPNNISCKDTYPTTVTAFNPMHDRLDATRLGIAGHSLGGIGVSVVQSYGATGAAAWPGKMDTQNPVKAAVAWDGIYTVANGQTGNAGGNGVPASTDNVPAVVPRVPILGVNGDYGLAPVPFLQSPDPKKTTTNFREWVKGGQPVIELTIAGSTHYEFSLLPNFAASSWCPDASKGECSGGWGNALTQHYSLAWFDRWLKKAGEPGFDSADSRLLADNGINGRQKLSFRYFSARNFPNRSNTPEVCENIRKGC